MKAWVSGSNNQDRGANITCGKRCNCCNFTANKEIRKMDECYTKWYSQCSWVFSKIWPNWFLDIPNSWTN